MVTVYIILCIISVTLIVLALEEHSLITLLIGLSGLVVNGSLLIHPILTKTTTDTPTRIEFVEHRKNGDVIVYGTGSHNTNSIIEVKLSNMMKVLSDESITNNYCINEELTIRNNGSDHLWHTLIVNDM